MTSSSRPARPRAPLQFLGLACAIGVSNIYFNQPLLLEMGKSFRATAGQVGLVAVATQFGYAAGLLFFVPLGDRGIRAAAVAGILVLSFVNYLGVRQGSLLQTAVTVAKVIAIGLLLAMVLAFGSPAQRPAPAALATAVSFREFVLAVSAALFTFGGWHMVTYTAGETRNPGRTIPQALVIGSVVVTACYVALNAAYLYLLPLDQVTSSARVAADAAQAMAGARGDQNGVHRGRKQLPVPLDDRGFFLVPGGRQNLDCPRGGGAKTNDHHY